MFLDTLTAKAQSAQRKNKKNKERALKS